MKKTVENRAYEDQVHFYGRIWMVSALIIMLLVPVSMCIYFGAWPDALAVLKGLLGVAPIYWTVCTIEVFTYAPMLGSGGTYLAFVTGNITNLKAPAAINPMQAAKVKPGSEGGGGPLHHCHCHHLHCYHHHPGAGRAALCPADTGAGVLRAQARL